jgi:acetylornithine deacetylase/succinyl-diaminopimelate desuccinylase-like protein
MLAEAGAPAAIDAVGNVIARLGGDGPPTVFAAHLDTVFAADTEIAFAHDGDRLAAPGIGDNSLGVAALLHLARHLRGRALRHPVALVATVGEEGLGDLRGAKALLEALPVRAFVAVEGSMIETLTVAAVGSLRLRVTVRGPGGHSWADRGAPSAIHGLVAMLRDALSVVPAGPQQSFNVGTITGGTAINAIADSASADLDLRAGDEAVLRAMADAVRGVLQAEGLTVDVEPLGHRPGGALDPADPLLAQARRARAHAGLPPAREEASSTDANAAHGRGIPAITVGITTGGNAHRLDEYVDLAPIAGGLRALALLADEIDAGDER